MTVWANFLGMFLPDSKSDDMVRRVTAAAYRPLAETIRSCESAKTTLHLSGTLARRLEATGGQDVLDALREAAACGQVELTGGAIGNTILNLLPAQEVCTLIEQNTAILREYFGASFLPRGFFPPDMAYSRVVGDVAAELGFEWVLVDEMGHSGKPGTVLNDRLYSLRGHPNFRVFFRDRSLSTGLSYGSFKTPEMLAEAIDALSSHAPSGNFLVTGNEAELYGYHRRNAEKTLQAFYGARLPMATVSELLEMSLPCEESDPSLSTWSQWEVLQF